MRRDNAKTRREKKEQKEKTIIWPTIAAATEQHRRAFDIVK